MSGSGHWLIIGTTESGKSSLAKALSIQYQQRGVNCIVLDAMRDPGWGAKREHVFKDSDVFLDFIMDPDNQRCALFIDETGQNINKNDPRYRWTTTTSRHHGHRAHLLAQRPEAIDRTTRSQCGTLAAFHLSSPDAKQYARDYACDELLQCPTFKQGEYILKRRFQPAERRILFKAA